MHTVAVAVIIADQAAVVFEESFLLHEAAIVLYRLVGLPARLPLQEPLQGTGKEHGRYQNPLHSLEMDELHRGSCPSATEDPVPWLNGQPFKRPEKGWSRRHLKGHAGDAIEQTIDQDRYDDERRVTGNDRDHEYRNRHDAIVDAFGRRFVVSGKHSTGQERSDHRQEQGQQDDAEHDDGGKIALAVRIQIAPETGSETRDG